MWGFLSSDSKLGSVILKLVNLFLLSVLWLALCCTVVCAGPATAALYYVVVKCLRRGRGSLPHEYFSCFQLNFRCTWVYGALTIISWLYLLIFDLPQLASSFMDGAHILWILAFIVKLFLLVGITLYCFPLISRFELTGIAAIVQSIHLAVTHFGHTVLLTVILFISLFLIKLVPGLIMIIPSIFSYISSFFLEPIFKAMVPQKVNFSQDDAWYLE